MLRLTLLLAPALLLAGCGSPQRQSARVLQQRLQERLAPDIAAQRASVQPLDDGAQVKLSEPALFQANKAELTPGGGYTVASVVEALLDPRLMAVDLTGAPDTPDDLRDARVQTVQHTVQEYSLGPPLALTAPMQPSVNAAGQGMTIMIRVHCPPGPQGTTWGFRNRRATCN